MPLNDSNYSGPKIIKLNEVEINAHKENMTHLMVVLEEVIDDLQEISASIEANIEKCEDG